MIGIHRILELSSKPSDLIGIEDEYTAFCFDEACAFIIQKLKDGEKPILEINSSGEKVYKKPSDLYNKYNNN